jgi:hypothetical protein
LYKRQVRSYKEVVGECETSVYRYVGWPRSEKPPCYPHSPTPWSSGRRQTTTSKCRLWKTNVLIISLNGYTTGPSVYGCAIQAVQVTNVVQSKPQPSHRWNANQRFHKGSERGASRRMLSTVCPPVVQSCTHATLTSLKCHVSELAAPVSCVVIALVPGLNVERSDWHGPGSGTHA